MTIVIILFYVVAIVAYLTFGGIGALIFIATRSSKSKLIKALGLLPLIIFFLPVIVSIVGTVILAIPAWYDAVVSTYGKK